MNLPSSRKVEREKGFEPSTSTLARSHSTAELLPRRALDVLGRARSVKPVGSGGRLDLAGARAAGNIGGLASGGPGARRRDRDASADAPTAAPCAVSLAEQAREEPTGKVRSGGAPHDRHSTPRVVCGALLAVGKGRLLRSESRAPKVLTAPLPLGQARRRLAERCGEAASRSRPTRAELADLATKR
jgi:hypothetical protein